MNAVDRLVGCQPMFLIFVRSSTFSSQYANLWFDAKPISSWIYIQIQNIFFNYEKWCSLLIRALIGFVNDVQRSNFSLKLCEIPSTIRIGHVTGHFLSIGSCEIISCVFESCKCVQSVHSIHLHVGLSLAMCCVLVPALAVVSVSMCAVPRCKSSR